jgi:hypothetical protein
MQCDIINDMPIPLHIGVMRNIVTMPPLILYPNTICSHKNGMPNMKDNSKNWTRKFAVKEKMIFGY